MAVINMANAYRELGQEDEALAGYEHYLRLDPNNAWVHYQAGEIHLDQGRVDRAEGLFRQALAIDPRVAPAHVALGAVAITRGDGAGAEREIRAALGLTARRPSRAFQPRRACRIARRQAGGPGRLSPRDRPARRRLPGDVQRRAAAAGAGAMGPAPARCSSAPWR